MYEYYIDIAHNELQNIDGIGLSQIDSLKKFFLKKQNLIIVSNLINLIDIQDYKITSRKTHLTGKSIVFTGTFKNKSRSELKAFAENLGAKIVSNISQKTNFLVVGSEKPTNRKIIEARKLKIKIMDENKWNKITNR